MEMKGVEEETEGEREKKERRERREKKGMRETGGGEGGTDMTEFATRLGKK